MNLVSLLCKSSDSRTIERTPLFRQNNSQSFQSHNVFKNCEQSKINNAVAQHVFKQKKISLKMFNPLKLVNQIKIKKEITLNHKPINFEKKHENRRIQLAQNKKEKSVNQIQQLKKINKNTLNNFKSQKIMVECTSQNYLNESKYPKMMFSYKINSAKVIETENKVIETENKIIESGNNINKQKIMNQKYQNKNFHQQFKNHCQIFLLKNRQQQIAKPKINIKYVAPFKSNKVFQWNYQENTLPDQLDNKNRKKDELTQKNDIKNVKIKEKNKSQIDLLKIKQQNKEFQKSKSKESFTTLANSYFKKQDQSTKQDQSFHKQYKFINNKQAQHKSINHYKQKDLTKKPNRNYSFFKGIDSLEPNKLIKNHLQNKKLNQMCQKIQATEKKLSSLKIKPAQSFVESQKSSSQYSEVQYILSARMQI